MNNIENEIGKPIYEAWKSLMRGREDLKRMVGKERLWQFIFNRVVINLR